jgi:DNA repair protein RecO (recombination protein O)
MSTRIELHPGYILHTRPYRDTSLIVDVLTQDYGKIGVVAKGARKAKNHQRYLLQAFRPVLLSWQGKSSLKTLIGIESALTGDLASIAPLQGVRLYSAMYVNELLMYLLPQDDPQEAIFPYYRRLLAQLALGEALEPCLRCFELQLLENLGYGLDCSHDADSGEPLMPEKYYYYSQSHGFVLTDKHIDIRAPCFLGRDLLLIAQRDFQQVDTQRAAKQLIRMALQPLLRGRELKSRELFTIQ